MEYKENKKTALDNYIRALTLGGTKTLPELFNAAGLPFDFSPEYISELMCFIKTEEETLVLS